MEIGCLLAAYLQTLASEFVAVVPPRKYCQAVRWQGRQQGQMSSVGTASSLFHTASGMVVQEGAGRGEEHPAPRG